MLRITLRGLLAHKLRLALTAFAVVIGVTFVTGTLVLGDTLNRTFTNLIGTVYQHVSFEIRGKAEFSDNGAGGVDDTSNRKPIPDSIIRSVRALPGVQFAYGSVSGYAQMIAPDGKVIGKAGRAAGFSFDPNRQLSAFRLVSGKPPTNSDSVVIDKATADKYGLKLGDRLRILLSGPTRTFTVTGIATFGSDDNLVGETLAAFYLPTAQRLFGSVGRYAAINVLAKPGADNVALERAIARVLPPGVQVLTGQQIANQVTSAINNDLSFLTTALLIFAFISLFVGGFTIFNTFSITIGQRTRELALLRVVGASRRQIFGSVLIEAALTGLVGALIGLGLGVAAAVGLRALLSAFSLTLPSAPLVFEARTPVVALAVGIGVTVISAIAPARRAVRIAPVAALSAQTESRRTASRRRRVVGLVFLALGILVVISGVHKARIGSVGFGALLLFVAATLLLPVLASPLAGALGRPFAFLMGTPGRLGRSNSLRSPRRTAQTAAALMIGLALVSTISVLGASLSASAKQNVDDAVRADYLITAASVSRDVPSIVKRLPGVAVATTIYQGQVDVGGSLTGIAAASPQQLDRTVGLTITAGRGAQALADGELLIDASTARSDHLRVGSTLKMTFAQTGPTTMRVGGIFALNSLVGSYVVSDAYYVAHFSDPLPSAVLVAASPRAGNLVPELSRALRAYPSLKIRTRAQFEQDQQNSIDSTLNLVYVLLALAVLVALIGIVNTLLLSVFERTREIGLLRAVGMTRRQVVDMICSEAVVIALFGAVVGIVLGGVLGVALAGALRDNGVPVVSLPVGSLVIFLVIAGVMGLIAAVWPAARAAKLNLLEAIATE